MFGGWAFGYHRDGSLTTLSTPRQANKHESIESYIEATDMPKRKKGDASRNEAVTWLMRQMKGPEICMARSNMDPNYTRAANLEEHALVCEVPSSQSRISA